MSRRLSLLALGTLALLAGAPPASAGSCCQCATPCAAPMVQMVAPRAYYSATQFYIVNEGPTYSGPGILTLPPSYPYAGNGCCAGQYQVAPYQQPYRQVMPEPQGMPYQGESYEDDSDVAPGEPGIDYRRNMRRHRPAMVHYRPVRTRVVTRGREMPFHPTKRRPFDPRDK